METQTIWRPWHDMHRLQRELDQLFSEIAPAGRSPLTGEYPPVNISRADGSLILEAMCPGVERDTLDVTVVGEAVTLRCERKPPPDVPPDLYHRRERPVGTFTRTIALGERFDPDRTQATYKNGILRVELGRAPESTPKKLQIQG